MSRKTKKLRDASIIGLGLIPTLAILTLLPSDLYLLGLIGLIVFNLVLLVVLVPSAIALQSEPDDHRPTLIWVMNRADQN